MSARFQGTTRSLRRARLGVALPLSLGWPLLLSACDSPGNPLAEPATLGQPIVGGEIDTTTHAVVSLNIDAVGHYFPADCSGALVAPNLVLTARHCVAFTADSPEAPVTCSGTRFIRDRDPQTILISTATDAPEKGAGSLHPAAAIFVPDQGDSICGFDLALLQLTDPIPASEATPLAPRLSAPARTTEIFSALGFGLTGADAGGGQRRRSDGNTITCAPGTCTAQDPNITDSEWLSEAAPLCHGDSGGPALDAQGRVIGVASRGAADCSSVVYSDVSAWGALISRAAVAAAHAAAYAVPSWVVESPEAGATDGGTARDAAAPDGDAAATTKRKDSSGCAIHTGSNDVTSPYLFVAIEALGFVALGARRRAKTLQDPARLGR